MQSPVKASLTVAFIPLTAKRTFPPQARSAEENFSDFTTALIIVALSFSDLAVVVTKLDLTFVDLFLSPALFSFSEILFGSEINLDFVALDTLFYSYG